MRPKVIEMAPAAVDADGIAEAQAVASAAALVLDGVLISLSKYTADLASKIGIVCAGDDSGITFTVVGLSPEGQPQTEVITGGNIATVESTKYFSAIFSITTSGAVATTVAVGTVDEFVSPIIPLNHYAFDGATISLEGFVGTIDVSVEILFTKLQQGYDNVFFAGPAALTNVTADAYSDINAHASGVRLVCNSFSSGAGLTFIVNQNR